MKLDEAIKRAEEVAEEQTKLCKRYDDASGYSKSHNEAIRTTAAKKCEKCAKEHRQFTEWLKDYKRLKEQETTIAMLLEIRKTDAEIINKLEETVETQEEIIEKQETLIETQEESIEIQEKIIEKQQELIERLKELCNEKL